MDWALRINKSYSTCYYVSLNDEIKKTTGRKAYFKDLLFYITKDNSIIESTTGLKIPIKLEDFESYLIDNYYFILEKIRENEKINIHL